jgi:alginate O-acetyltransferase complex protein AlgI
MASQLEDRSASDSIDNKLQGFIRFMIGLAKKVLIANVLGVEVDRIFALAGDQLTTPLAWFGILAFAFQIYFDFAGYSDMAIGLGRMMGFKLPENFNNPYTSQNITDFWRRWHMTLSSWLRDYLFMPMSVSMRHAGKLGVVISVMITFVICGMWHQPGWTFIVWGAWHGLWLALDQLFLIKVLKKTGRVVATLFTFFITTIGWVFFRADSFGQAGLFLKRMFVYRSNGDAWGLHADFWVVFALAVLFSFVVAIKPGRRLEEWVFEKKMNMGRLILFGCLAIALFVVCMGSINSSGFIPFIYNRF